MKTQLTFEEDMALDDYRKKFDELFKGLKTDEAEKIDDSTLRIIDHAARRVEYTEGKRKATLEISLGLITFSVLLIGLVYQYFNQWFILFLPSVASLAFIGVLNIVLYVFQERFKRPFIEVAKTWRWFYHYCIDPNVPLGPFLSSCEKEKSKQGYLDGLFIYAQNTIDTTPQTRLRQDIEQLFILLTTERLKNEFLKRQQGVLGYGILASLFTFLIDYILPWERLACIISFEFNVFRSLLSIMIFVIVVAVLYGCKVFRITKSREPWNYVTEEKS